ncbi:unnamed protein product [Meganyctiphanes norvegica]|uniref:Rieske domain-containing protein n=1 Tax=Meganyctiphanes norvegica TaxID=48144 RepID=A0AAV2RUL4_MEGNR
MDHFQEDGQFFFHVHQISLYDLYDWSKVTDNNSEMIVSHSNVSRNSFTDTGRPNKAPSRRSGLRTGTLVRVNENDVALFRFGETVYGISEKCPHAGGPLHVGDIEELPDQSLCVRCPYHGWKFDLATGKCRHPSSRGDMSTKVYPVKVDHYTGDLSVGFIEFSPLYFSTPMIFGL